MVEKDKNIIDFGEIKIPKIKKQGTNTLFSEKEVKDIVKGFIMAYVQGKMTIVTPDNKVNKSFLECIRICAGERLATESEVDNAISYLFTTIIAARSAGRLKGEFGKSSMEERLFELEEDSMKKTDKLEQLSIDFKDFKDQLDFFKKGMSQ